MRTEEFKSAMPPVVKEGCVKTAHILCNGMHSCCAAECARKVNFFQETRQWGRGFICTAELCVLCLTILATVSGRYRMENCLRQRRGLPRFAITLDTFWNVSCSAVQLGYGRLSSVVNYFKWFFFGLAVTRRCWYPVSKPCLHRAQLYFSENGPTKRMQSMYSPVYNQNAMLIWSE